MFLQTWSNGNCTAAIVDGQSHYLGRTRGGVESLPYGPFPGSYRIELVRLLTSVPNTSSRPFAVDRKSTRTRRAMAIYDASGMSGSPGLYNLREHVGKAYTVNVIGNTQGIVWGTDVYTDDSNLGAAAVHAGLLATWFEQGLLEVTIIPGQTNYSGTTQRRFMSSSYSRSWPGSFSTSAGPPGTSVAPALETIAT